MSSAVMRWFGDAIKRDVEAAGSDALGDALEYLLEESNRTVPIEEGTLARSGSTDVDGREGSIYYDTAYAARQHEETDWRHADGRRAKWLQLTMQEQRRRVADFLQGRIGRAFR